MNVYIFLGPTLPRDEAGYHLPSAQFLPPVQAGDVARLCKQDPDVIGIVDGVFEQAPSVWHKEILYALSEGIRVYGCSSMGALRAAEMHRYGMVGVGEIFGAFRDGILEDDDEVAVEHATGEHAYRPLSVAMVNLRHGLQLARARGIIGLEAEQVLVEQAKRAFFADRSWSGALKTARGVLSADELRALAAFVDAVRPDLKRDDAVRMLQRIASDLGSDLHRARPDLDFEPTSDWERMQASLDAAQPAEPSP